MKKFKRINSYNKKYSEKLDKSIKLIMPILIEAFVNVYGEEHRNYITYTLNNINFVYFISEKMMRVANTYDANLSNNQKYIVKYYLKYLKNIDYIGNGIKDEDIWRFVYDKLIVKSDLSYEDMLFNNLLLYDDPIFTFADLDDIVKIIKLPIYTIDLKTIIHELNHALCIEAVAVNDDEIISIDLFQNAETIEIINDYIAELVLKEYLKIGGVIPKTLKIFNIINRYEYNYYLVEYLFDNLSPLILESLITNNVNMLINFIGEDNYIKLDNLINDLYVNGFNKDKFYMLLNLINDMYLEVVNKDVISTLEYLNKTESNGYKLRRLK